MMTTGVQSTYEVLRTIVTVLFFAFVIRAFVVQPFVVEGKSMEPTFHDQDYLLVNKYDYRLRDPARGDIVVFVSPTIKNTNFIKRIVGLPGDLVRIENDDVLINGTKIDEPYITPEVDTPNSFRATQVERFLNQNEYWVMGDNRNHSSDSREWGPLQRSAIVGRAWITVFPRTDFGVLRRPSYAL